MIMVAASDLQIQDESPMNEALLLIAKNTEIESKHDEVTF